MSRFRLRDYFSYRPKTPGFGISSDFYLSVLSETSTLPPILAVVSPDGAHGSVPGFGAPLAGGKDRTLLTQPMQRGGYVIASRDRKSVLKAVVMPKDETGIDFQRVADVLGSAGAQPELVARVRSTWWVVQLSFGAHDPMVLPSLEFLSAVVARLGDLVGGAIADPLSNRYLLPSEIAPHGAFDAGSFVAVARRAEPTCAAVHTLGMAKFALPEMEVRDVPPECEAAAHAFLASLAQTVLMGNVIGEGAIVGERGAALVARGIDEPLGFWQGRAALELVPERVGLADALAPWA